MKLNKREYAILVFGLILVGVLSYYLFVISPSLENEKTYQRYIANKERDLQEMLLLKAKWEEFSKRKKEATTTFRRRGKNFTLLSFLEGVAKKAGISQNIQYMKPLTFSEDSGDLKPEGMQLELKDIDIRQLVRLLSEIENSSQLLTVQRIMIRRSSAGDTHLLKVVLQVKSYRSA